MVGGRGVTLLLAAGVLIAAAAIGVHGALLPAAVPTDAPAQCVDARERDRRSDGAAQSARVAVVVWPASCSRIVRVGLGR